MISLLSFGFLALRRSGTCRHFHRYFVKQSRLDPKRNIFEENKKTSTYCGFLLDLEVDIKPTNSIKNNERCRFQEDAEHIFQEVLVFLDSHWTGPGLLDSHWTGLGMSGFGLFDNICMFRIQHIPFCKTMIELCIFLFG